MFRIGHGYDVHRIFNKKSLISLGGIKIPAPYYIEAHSDGDVLLHALSNALLGAIAFRDIGYHFSNNEKKYENKESRYFIKKVYSYVVKEGYIINNIDATIIAQEPKLTPHIESMIKKIGELLSISTSKINVKANTGENIGSIGKKQGIACHVIALIMKNNINTE